MATRQGDPIAPRDGAAWRRWLAKHHARPAGAWLLIKKKGSAAPGVPYEEAVRQALCFGWIDGQAKRHDDDHYAIWFAPRKPRGVWSALNKRRVEELAAEGLIEAPGQAAIDLAKRNGSWDALAASDSLVVPDDLARALDAKGRAREHWDGFPPSTRKQILAWIGMAKRPETRAKRIEETADLAAENIRANRPRPPR